MPYTKTLTEIAAYLLGHPGYVINREKGPLILISGPNNDESLVIMCYSADPDTGELTHISKNGWSLKTLYEKELILEDGNLFVKMPTATQPKSNPIPKEDSIKPSAPVSRSSGIKSIGEHPQIVAARKEIESSKHSISSQTKAVYYQSYKDLFAAMDSACNSLAFMKGLSHHFWHYCSFQTAISIIESGEFLSRSELTERHIDIPFDNLNQNETTRIVMDKNRSTRVEKYCRFFLRPRNGPSYNIAKNMREKGKEPVLFAINRSALWFDDNHPTFLFFGCAGAYPDAAFDWNVNNIKTMSRLKKRNFSEFDWQAVYAYFSSNADEDIKIAQKSEFAVYQSLPISYIEAIYFGDESYMRTFQTLIRSKHPDLAAKCVIREDLLWRK